jgi:acetoin utilization deacetylase AcuC-like enzyme
VDCALYALQYGVAFNAAGGTHHAYADKGEGFCLLNDIAMAANFLLDNGLARQILVVDLDVHQGNGTAAIFQHEPRVFTFSMHGAKNYPLFKEVSNVDVALADGSDDTHYLSALEYYLPRIIDCIQPDFVFYQAGVDILATDKLGRLGVSMDGCRRRDKFVFDMCYRHSIPVAVSMGGGYSPRLTDIVMAHCNTYRAAVEVFF